MDNLTDAERAIILTVCDDALAYQEARQAYWMEDDSIGAIEKLKKLQDVSIHFDVIKALLDMVEDNAVADKRALEHIKTINQALEEFIEQRRKDYLDTI